MKKSNINGSVNVINKSEKMLDMEEMAKMLIKVPEQEKWKLYYMMEGMVLMGEQVAHPTDKAG